MKQSRAAGRYSLFFSMIDLKAGWNNHKFKIKNIIALKTRLLMLSCEF